MSKVTFFGLAPWEREYYEKKGTLTNLGEVTFVEGIINDDNLPTGGATEAEVISLFVDSKITPKVLAALPNLKHISTRSTGFDHIDLNACKEKGISVSTVPGYGEIPVAEQTFALLLAVSRHIYEGFDRIREEAVFSPEGLKGFNLFGKTIGIVGTGKIGKHVAQIAKGFGMKLVAYDPYPNEQAAKEIGFEYLPLEELLKQSDVVTLHAPYSKENHHLIDGAKLALMKPSAVLINTARGALVDTPALAKALKENKLAGAGLDVLEEEGVIKDEFGYATSAEGPVDIKAVLANHVLFDLPNVVIMPHNAFNTQEALELILDITAENIKNYLQGQPSNVIK